LTTDQRGFASIIQSEAAEFLPEEQVLLNTTVKTIRYSNDRVLVSLSDGTSLSADYALVTFSLGVLQHDDVSFEPALPKWKSEAIHGMAMVSRVTRDDSSPSYNRAQGTYTKIYLQFPEKFWFDTEVHFVLTFNHWRSDSKDDSLLCTLITNGDGTPSGRVLISMVSSQVPESFSSPLQYASRPYFFCR
jgi:hypothetical protein